MSLGTFEVFVDNDNTFTLPAVTNEITRAVETGATVTLTIVTLGGTEVGGITWPKTMAHIGDGTYQVTIDKALEIVANTRYRAKIVLTDGSGGDGAWDIPFIPEVRED